MILCKTDLSKKDLSHWNLSGWDLTGANLSEGNLFGANLDGATLIDACLWKTQRVGWSIKGVVCERIYLDEERKDRKTYGLGEFEPITLAGVSLNTLVSPGIKVDLQERSVVLPRGRTKIKKGAY